MTGSNYVGTPGAVHPGSVVRRGLLRKAPASFSATGVIINEVRNDTSDANLDWIELHHHADIAATTAATAQNIDENWTSLASSLLPRVR